MSVLADREQAGSGSLLRRPRTLDTVGLLARQLPSMRAWVDLLSKTAGESRLWDTGFQFGDWLDPAAPNFRIDWIDPSDPTPDVSSGDSVGLIVTFSPPSTSTASPVYVSGSAPAGPRARRRAGRARRPCRPAPAAPRTR